MGLQSMVSALCQVESWAFAVDKAAMDLLIVSGVFYTRECKLCDDGVVVMGEYGLSKAVLERGYNIATLMSMCVSSFLSKATMQPQCANVLVPMLTCMPGLHYFKILHFQECHPACILSLKSSRLCLEQ